MNCNTKKIRNLIEECTTHLKQLGYSDACIANHQKNWSNGILSYMQESKLTDYNSQIGEDYLQLATTVAPSTKRGRKRNIHILSDFLETGTIHKRIVHLVDYPLSGEIGQISELFLHELKLIRRNELTILEHRRMLSYFIAGLEVKSIFKVTDIRQEDILDFIDAAQTCKDKHYNTMRLFCKHLYEYKLTPINLAYVISKNRFPIHEKLPSVYSAEEIKQIETSVEQSSHVGKRDYAILLLATRLGLRASDICGLTFSNIDWDTNKIIMTQFKTGRLIELPLLIEIGEAIVNYLKYARPKSDLLEVFLTASAPYRQMNHIGLNGIVARIMRQSGVDISKRKFGPHAMRHTLASQLLRNGVSLPIISEALGHENTQTTMEYIRIDVCNLIKCTLDVPIVDHQFYKQKKGVFYEQL